MNYLLFKGEEIKVGFANTEDGKGHYFNFPEHGINTNLIVLDPQTYATTKIVILSYLVSKLDNIGGEISLTKGSETFNDKGETYNKWYSYQFSGGGGDFLFSPSCNGVLGLYKKDKNLYCYNPLASFNFFQPVIFGDCIVTETTIELVITDGATQITGKTEAGENILINKTVEYSLDGTTWQVSSLFSGLIEGTEYVGQARTQEDGWVAEISITTEVTPVVDPV